MRLNVLFAAAMLAACSHPRRQDRPIILNLYPASTRAGQSFYTQGDGQAAMGISCRGVAGGAKIVFNGRVLPAVSAMKGCGLSATIPADLYAKPGKYEVWIRDSQGDSDARIFTVE